MRIKKGDNVKIIIGKDRGKQGKVLKVDVKDKRLLVEGINFFKKHQKPKKSGEKGEIITVARFIDVSNAAIVCSTCEKATRIGYKFEDDKKVRICKKCENPF